MIIGLTGTLASGKDEFSRYLKQKGFEAYSLSDMIRDEAKQRGLELTRENLQKLGNELRRKRGFSALADMVLGKLRPGKNYVISSIRNPSEVEALRNSGSFTMVFVDAPIMQRFNRVISRARAGEQSLTFEQFRAQEEKEMASDDPSSQQLLRCRQMSDFELMNDSTIAEFHAKIEKIIGSLNKQ